MTFMIMRGEEHSIKLNFRIEHGYNCLIIYLSLIIIIITIVLVDIELLLYPHAQLTYP